jgi:hypothetical protein
MRSVTKRGKNSKGRDARMEAKSTQMPVHTSRQARRAMEKQTPMGSSDMFCSFLYTEPFIKVGTAFVYCCSSRTEGSALIQRVHSAISGRTGPNEADVTRDRSVTVTSMFPSIVSLLPGCDHKVLSMLACWHGQCPQRAPCAVRPRGMTFFLTCHHHSRTRHYFRGERRAQSHLE